MKELLIGLSCVALVGCHQQSWPGKDDVYHRQIVLPPPDGSFTAGLHYIDEKTGKIAPEVCDTYGNGETVCSEASFDPAPPVAQFRADLAKREAEMEKLEKEQTPQRINGAKFRTYTNLNLGWPGDVDANGFPIASEEAKRKAKRCGANVNPLYVEKFGHCPNLR